MPIRIPVVQTGLEASIQAAAKKAGKAMKIDMGAGAKSIESLSQPLGRITGKADQFTKSMEAANARVLAFGASVGVLSAVSRGFQELVKTTIEVEKRLTSINSILGGTTAQLHKFKKEIFDVARNTEQSFDTVSQAALELSRQGLKAEQVTNRLNDSLILARLSGLGASEAVFGLTAAINSFRKEGISSAEVLNKLSAAAISAAVSEKDLIEGIKRSGSVATLAGVSFNELIGVITAVQERTARGGAVIGNSFKTIFTRIQSLDKLKTMQQLGVQVEDASGQVLGATKLIQNLAKTLEKLPDATRLQIAENLVGKFQIAPFLAILEDYNSATSTAIRVTEVAAGATSEAYQRNIAISKTLSHAINETVLSVKELADTLGKIGVTDNLRGILDFFGNLVGNLNKVLEGDTLGSKFAKGIVKGIGGVLSGPGLAIFGAILAKLTIDLARFGIGSLKTFFGLNKAARDQVTLQGQIASTLLGNKGIQAQIMAIENSTLSIEQKRAAQTRFFTTALNEQLLIMTRMQAIAARVAPGVMAGTRGKSRGAGGYIPNFNATMGYGSEQGDISRGVGGAPKGARPVTIPNFNFGGGQRGTMIANTSEYVVPRFGGKSGSAIFNQDMASSLGLPAGAKKIGAAGGYIPNFAKKKSNIINADQYFYLVPDTKQAAGARLRGGGVTTVDGQKITGGKAYGLNPAKVKRVSDKDENLLETKITNSLIKHTAEYVTKLEPLGRKVNVQQVKKGFETTRGAKGALQGAIGSAFEVGITQALDYQAAAREKGGDFDVRRGVNIESIRNLFGLPPVVHTGDFKVNTGLPNVRSFYKKVIKESRAGKFSASEKKQNAIALARQEVRRDPKYSGLFRADGGDRIGQGATITKLVQSRLPRFQARFAEGYIPNFASPLEDAIGRESAAGLPINQIRVNQDSKLRNAGNPMGLGVTNTRDEPTGAIPRGAGGYVPNYYMDAVKGPVGGSSNYTLGTRTPTPTPVKPQRDLLGPIFAVTAAMSALQGATSGATSTVGKVTNEIAKMVASLATVVFASTALKGFTNDLKTTKPRLGAFLGGLTTAASAVVGTVVLYKGLDKALMESRGINDITKTTMARLADAASGAARKLESLGAVEGETLKQSAKIEFKKLFGPESSKSLPRQQGTGVAGERIVLETTPGGLTNKELVKAMEKLFTQSELAGVDPEIIRDIIRKEAEGPEGGVSRIRPRSFLNKLPSKEKDERPRLTPTEFDEATLKALRIIETAQKANSKDKEAFRILLKERGGGVEDLKGLLSGLSNSAPNKDWDFRRGGPVNTALGELRGSEFIGVGGTQRLAEKEQAIKERIKEIETEIAATTSEGKREELELTKALLKAALDKRQAELVDTSGLAQRIKFAKVLGTLSKDGIRNLETEKFEIELGNKLLKRRFELIKTGIDKLEGLTATTEQRVELEKELSKLTAGQLLDADEIKKVLIKVFGFSDKTRVAAERLSQNMADVVKAGDGAVVKMNALDLSTRRAADNTDRIRDNLDAARTLLDIKLSKDTFDTTFGANENIATINEQRRQAQRTLDRGGLNLEQREGLQRQIRGLNFGAANEQARIKDAGLTEKVRGFDLPMSDITRQGAEDLRSFGFDIKAVGVFIEQSGHQAQKTLAAAKTREEAFNLIDASLESLTGTEFATAKKRVEAFRQEIKLSEQSTEATLAQSKAELELIGARTKTSRDLNESARQLREVGLGGRARAAQRQAQAVETGRGDIDPALQQEISDLQRSVGQRLKEHPDFNALYQADTLASTITTAALNFKNTMSDAMVDAIIKGENLGDVLRSAATDFFTTLSKAYMNKAVNSIVGNSLGGGGGNSGGGSGGSALSFLGGLLGFGKKAKGGLITGGSGSRDDIPTLLTDGEFVIRKGAVAKYGAGFLEELNTGRIGQMQRGGLYSPGTYGQGAISGKRDLLDFATQSHTSGRFDQIRGGAGFGSVSLEPQSGALTMFGRRNSASFQKEQQSKGEAFGLFVQQIKAEEAAKEAKKQQKKGLMGALMAAVITGTLSTAFKGKPTANPNQKGILKAGSVEDWEIGGGGGGGDPLSRIFGRANADAAGGGRSSLFADRADDPNFVTNRELEEAAEVVRRLELGFNILPRKDWKNKAHGGAVPHAAGIDTVPTMLSGGEFVMNAAATQNIGRGNLAALNSGGGGEGSDGAVVARLDELIAVTDGNGESVINITVNSDGTETQDTNGDEQQQNLAIKIKDVVRSVIEEEQRLGGSLRRA